MVLGLTSCGGIKEEDLIESYTSAVAAFDDTVAVLNENINSVSEKTVSDMQEVYDKLNEYKTAIEEGKLRKKEEKNVRAYLEGVPDMMQHKLSAIEDELAAE